MFLSKPTAVAEMARNEKRWPICCFVTTHTHTHTTSLSYYGVWIFRRHQQVHASRQLLANASTRAHDTCATTHLLKQCRCLQHITELRLKLRLTNSVRLSSQLTGSKLNNSSDALLIWWGMRSYTYRPRGHWLTEQRLVSPLCTNKPMTGSMASSKQNRLLLAVLQIYRKRFNHRLHSEYEYRAKLFL